MYLLIIYTQLITQMFCLDQDHYDYNPNGMIVANIKRRDTIPLQPHARRYLGDNNLSYRKTKDIREEVPDRHFEITQAQVKAAQREEPFRNSPINEIIEEPPQMRLMRNARENGLRNNDMRENKISEFSNPNYNQNPTYHEKYHQDTINEMSGGQLRKTKRETMEDKMRYMNQVMYGNMRNVESRDKNFDYNYDLRNSRYNDRDHREVQQEMNWLGYDNRNQI